MMGKVCSKSKGRDSITYDTANRFVHVLLMNQKVTCCIHISDHMTPSRHKIHTTAYTYTPHTYTHIYSQTEMQVAQSLLFALKSSLAGMIQKQVRGGLHYIRQCTQDHRGHACRRYYTPTHLRMCVL